MAANRSRNRIMCLALLISCASIGAAQVPATSASDSIPVPFERDGRWGYEDGRGNTIVAPQFAKAEKFSDGLAAVYVEIAPASAANAIGSRDAGVPAIRNEKKWGFINDHGEMVIAPEFEAVGHFSEGLAAASRELPWSDGETWGYINKHGEMVIKPQFNAASPFSEGLALVYAGGIPLTDNFVLSFVKMGYIDKGGRWVIGSNFWYFFYDNFSEGVVPFRKNFGKWGYLNQQGKIFIRPQFDWAGSFFHGLAPVLVSGICTHIDKGGHIVGQSTPQIRSGKKNPEQDRRGTYTREPTEFPCL